MAQPTEAEIAHQVAQVKKLRKHEELDGSPFLIETPFIRIQFQLGPSKETAPNGCQVDDVIEILIARLEGFQKGKLACEHNRYAIKNLKTALEYLQRRTEIRTRKGVEGTSQE